MKFGTEILKGEVANPTEETLSTFLAISFQQQEDFTREEGRKQTILHIDIAKLHSWYEILAIK